MGSAIKIGSQLFINKDDTPAYVKSMVEKMKENGLEIIRLFMIWEQLEPKQGVWRFDSFDACFERACELGLAVVPTLMSVSPPGWMRLTNGPQSVADLDDPSYLETSRRYISKVVSRYRNAPSLDSWIVWNEASRIIPRSVHARIAYARFVQEKYKTIADYNESTYQKYESFEELSESHSSSGAAHDLPFASFEEKLDWLRFSVHNLKGHLQFIRNEIRKLDLVHPIHVNPHNLQMDMQNCGQSIWEESEIADFLGCSAHPMWHSLRFPERRWTQSVGFFSDLMKSATRDPHRKFWVTELQGGTTLYSSGKAYTPSAQAIRQWTWEGIGSGAKAVVFWCFNSRNIGYEAGEWSLLNQKEQPSPRLRAAQEVVSLLKEHDELFASAMPERGKVLILYSEASWALGHVEGEGNDPSNPRNRNMYADAMTGAYLLFSDLSIPVEFINEKRLVQEGVPTGIEVLILPNTIMLGEAELVVIETFVQQGGLVIADGLIGMKDANGKINPSSIQKAGRLFGVVIEDIETDNEDLEMTVDEDGGQLHGWFYRLPLQVVRNVSVLSRFRDGRPAVSVRSAGEGKAIRIGTSFFQHYFANPQEEALLYLVTLLGGRLQDGIRLLDSSRHLRLKQLDHPEGKILVFINEGKKTKACLSVPTPGTLIPLSEGCELEVGSRNNTVLPEIDEQAVSVWFFRLSKNEESK